MSAWLDAASSAKQAVAQEGDSGHVLSTLQALSALALLAALCWLVWRLRGSHARVRGSAQLVIEERLTLDLRSSLMIVRVDQRRLLLATSEHGPARLISELGSAASASAVAGDAAPLDPPAEPQRR